MYQWVDWITDPTSGCEVPNIECIIKVLPITRKNYGRPDSGIKSWAQPVKALKDILNKRQNLKGSMVFPPTVGNMA